MVLAAGLGTRMRPLTDDRPKALVEVAGRALIDHVLDRLAQAGVDRAVVNVHWFADRLEAHLAERSSPAIVISDERSQLLETGAHLAARGRGPRILLSDERAELLETGGGLKKARPLLGDDPIFVANIDSVWSDQGDALSDLVDLWDPSKMDAALLLARCDGAIGFDGAGDFFLETDGRLSFRGEAASAPYAYMGVHITRPDYADAGPEGAFSLSPLWRKSAAEGRLFGCVLQGDWMHVGDPQARDQAELKLAVTAFSPFEGAGPRWFAVAAHRPFLEDLAAGVLSWLGERAPETLSDATILLPNRRAARAFTTALSSLSADRPVLLPQVRPLGDLEEDEPPFTPGALGLDLAPAIPTLTRRFEMARMIVEAFDADLTPIRALDLADALGGFVDSCHLEEIKEPERVAHLVQGEMAAHWEASAEFLSLAVQAWPRRLQELGMVDSSWRRATLLRRLAEFWDQNPPQQPVIAAGSTGTVPAAADVLAAVAKAPMGCVVLPGLDLDLDDQVWRRLDEQHPQSAMKRLLDRSHMERDLVAPWFEPKTDPPIKAKGLARQRLINEALRPAEATDDWRGAIRDIRVKARGETQDPIALGLDGLELLSVHAEEEAAAAIALMMRETLETEGKTCALVTPDQALGRRVEARLARWGVIADSSAGAPLSRLPVGALLDLCARWLCDPIQPQLLLAIAKHPLVRLDVSASSPVAAVAAFEEHSLR
ncbi:hypothetical protein LTR94_024135, partial [Friedmanniomyces endolithicus]